MRQGRAGAILHPVGGPRRERPQARQRACGPALRCGYSGSTAHRSPLEESLSHAATLLLPLPANARVDRAPAMLSWLSRLWGGRAQNPAPPPTRVEPTIAPAAAHGSKPPSKQVPAATAATEAVAADPAATAAQRVLPWLLDCASPTASALSTTERAALDQLAATLALPQIPDNLLPRAAALIPQLISLVRQTELPTPAVAERVGKDAALTAEVLRLASSPYYRVQGEVSDLQQAISLIGQQGLQTVIARVLLKPIYQNAPGPLSKRAGVRMWEHSEALARHTGILAEQSGLNAFDGYLAGMLHDTGWTVALSALDRATIAPALPPSAEFAAALEAIVYRLFGHAAQRWDITPAFNALVQDVRSHGQEQASHPLAQLLPAAQQRCMDELLAP